MSLMDFASPLVAANNFVKASFGGFAGSGKTRTASEFIVGCYRTMGIEKPLLFIDNEKGSRFLVPFFKQHGVDVLVKDTLAVADVIQAMDYLRRGEIGFLFIDSLTKIWYQYIRDYKAANGKNGKPKPFMELIDWGKVLPAWQETFSDVFVSTEGNIVFTGRGGYEYEKEEDQKDDTGRIVKKGAMVKSGVKMKMAGETPFEPDLNVWMEQEQEIGPDGLTVYRTGMVMKDRSGLIDGKLFRNPTFADFAPVVSYLMAVPVGDVAGQSDTRNLAPREEYDGRRRRAVIAMEKIKGEYDKSGLGMSREEKQFKALAHEKVFGTTSWEQTERMDAEVLEAGTENLRYLFADFNAAKPENAVEWLAGYKLRGTDELPFDDPAPETPAETPHEPPTFDTSRCEEYIMPEGKHKGKALRDVPLDALAKARSYYADKPEHAELLANIAAVFACLEPEVA